MNRSVSKAVSIVIILIIVGVGSFAAYEYVTTQGTQTNTVCNTCFVNEPVVDVIVPSLISNSGGVGSNNSPLNVTRGQNISLVVQIYPTEALNAQMNFSILSSPSPASSVLISGTFNPKSLSIAAQAHENATLSLSVPNNTPVGSYSVAVSAVDSDNSSWTWGDVFTMNVS